MVVLRLSRQGAKKRPFYRIVAADKRRPRDGAVIEELGTYDPRVQETDARAILKAERIDYWLSVGAQPSDNVRVLIKKYGTNGTHVTAQKAALERISAPKAVPDPGAPASLPKSKRSREESAAASATNGEAGGEQQEAEPAGVAAGVEAGEGGEA